MHENIIALLIENNVQQLYVTNRSTAATARRLSGTVSSFLCEASTNEKIAYELALAGSYANKRTACILSTEGLYEALDPVMSSAYTGVAGSLVIVAVQEIDEEITPIGVFSKLPLIVTETDDELNRAVPFAFSMSEEFKIPVMVQAAVGKYGNTSYGAIQRPSLDEKIAGLVKEPGRWAATPKFRYQLHGELNEKIEKIRKVFEKYEDNKIIKKNATGLITDKISRLEFYDEDASLLKLSTIYPLPEKLVQGFVDSLDEVLVVETYPAIELQIPDRTKVKSGFLNVGRGNVQHEEKIQGFTVVRDKLGPGSSINMAHGLKKVHPEKKYMAITFEDHFFHSGMPAYINSLYNDTANLLVIMVSENQAEIRKILKSYGVDNVVDVNDAGGFARFADATEPVVALYRGIL